MVRYDPDQDLGLFRPNIFILYAAEIYQMPWLEESGQRLEIFGRTHLVLDLQKIANFCNYCSGITFRGNYSSCNFINPLPIRNL